jgi:tetratricopeptide (TPR) repeat protein
MKKIVLSVAIALLFVSNSFGQAADTYNAKATEKILKQDYQEAILMYDKSIALNPKDALTYYNRGIAKLNISETKNACIDFKKALELGYKKSEEVIEKFCH